MRDINSTTVQRKGLRHQVQKRYSHFIQTSNNNNSLPDQDELDDKKRSNNSTSRRSLGTGNDTSFSHLPPVFCRALIVSGLVLFSGIFSLHGNLNEHHRNSAHGSIDMEEFNMPSQTMKRHSSSAAFVKNTRWLAQPRSGGGTASFFDSDDPLTGGRSSNNNSTRRNSLDYIPKAPLLGVMVDASKHHFSMGWLYNLTDLLADMRYNLIHLRLTADSAFNILLDSHPEFAHPVPSACEYDTESNSDECTSYQAREERAVEIYTADQLRQWTAYAARQNVTIMPEINLPQAGAWAAVIPGLMAKCTTDYICHSQKAIPLTLTHPQLPRILKNIIGEIIEIFNNPPLLHLGGDGIEGIEDCIVARKIGESLPIPQHTATNAINRYMEVFDTILESTLKELNYPEDRVLRWVTASPTSNIQLREHKTGKIRHYSGDYLSGLHSSSPSAKNHSYFVSSGLNFDEGDDDPDKPSSKIGVLIFANVRSILAKESQSNFLGVIVQTRDLSPELWFDRNIVGRLLATAMGAGKLETGINAKFTQNARRFRSEFLQSYNDYCSLLGLSDYVCSQEGRSMSSNLKRHQRKMNEQTESRIAARCERLTKSDSRILKDFSQQQLNAASDSADYFWNTFASKPLLHRDVKRQESFSAPRRLPGKGRGEVQYVVPHTGVILDVANSFVPVTRLIEIIEFLAELRFNFVQLRLVNNQAFVYKSKILQQAGFSSGAMDENSSYSLDDLEVLVKIAAGKGIAIMPEITVSTDAGGWFGAGFLLDCANHLCAGGSVPNDVENPNFLPVAYSVIAELRNIFNRSNFFHLGTDERVASLPCSDEAGRILKFDAFERDLTTLLETSVISSEHILRWENDEIERYAERTGDITQYRADLNLEEWEVRANETFFLTVDLLAGDTWTVYDQTRKLVARRPLGILLELVDLDIESWESKQIPKLLLAFAVGASEVPTGLTSYFFTSFGYRYRAFCSIISKRFLTDMECSPVENRASTFEPKMKAFDDKVCRASTLGAGERYPKSIVEPFLADKVI